MRKDALVLTLVVVVVLGLVLWVGDLRRFDPSDVSVVLQGDGVTHQLGWEFFRQQPLQFPFGELPGYLWPAGTSLTQTDSIPLVALALRPFSAVLPSSFQYFGLWLLFCHTAAALFAWRALQLLGVDVVGRACGAVVVATSAFLFARWVHPALCAHFLVLAAFVWALEPSRTRTRIALAASLALTVGVHPYLAVMVAAIIIGTSLRDRTRSLEALVHVLLAIAVAFALGVVGDGGELAHARGYGTYAFDVLGFINGPAARIGRVLSFDASNSEGFAYVGVGVLVWLAIAVVVIVRRGQRPKGLGALFIVCGVLCLFAVSLHVSIAGIYVVDFAHLSLLFEPVPSMLRATGRFAWPLAYLLMLFAVAVVARMRPVHARAILVLGTLLHIVDVVPNQEPSSGTLPPDAAQFLAVAAQYRTIEVLPPAFAFVECAGADAREGSRYRDPSWIAARAGWSVNAGYAARARATRLESYCTSFWEQLKAGPASEFIYVLHAEGTLDNRWRCGTTILGTTCVDARNTDSLATSLAASPASR